MASGFWQVSSCAANGWVSRDFFINLWYSFKAALNIEEKLSVEGLAVWLLEDIGAASLREGKLGWLAKSCKTGFGLIRGQMAL